MLTRTTHSEVLNLESFEYFLSSVEINLTLAFKCCKFSNEFQVLKELTAAIM
jgi:hypothetical protein